MIGLMKNDVIPMLQKHFKTPAIVHKTILTQGIGESIVAEKIKDWEEALPQHIKLAYLPAVGSVRLRISAFGKEEHILKQEVDDLCATLLPLIEKYVFGYDNETLEKNVGTLLKEKGKTLAVAESCTGGYISHLITKVPGSSAYLKGSVVSYANEIKTDFLDVDVTVIQSKGAVSEEVVKQMAQHILQKFNTDYSIATSGIAGPDGGSEEKPVGTVWIAVANKDKVVTQKYLMGNNRERTIERTSLTSLMMLRNLILNKERI
jgi:nicotinamide-nucleotide amidase